MECSVAFPDLVCDSFDCLVILSYDNRWHRILFVRAVLCVLNEFLYDFLNKRMCLS